MAEKKAGRQGLQLEAITTVHGVKSHRWKKKTQEPTQAPQTAPHNTEKPSPNVAPPPKDDFETQVRKLYEKRQQKVPYPVLMKKLSHFRYDGEIREGKPVYDPTAPPQRQDCLDFLTYRAAVSLLRQASTYGSVGHQNTPHQIPTNSLVAFLTEEAVDDAEAFAIAAATLATPKDVVAEKVAEVNSPTTWYGYFMRNDVTADERVALMKEYGNVTLMSQLVSTSDFPVPDQWWDTIADNRALHEAVCLRDDLPERVVETLVHSSSTQLRERVLHWQPIPPHLRLHVYEEGSPSDKRVLAQNPNVKLTPTEVKLLLLDDDEHVRTAVARRYPNVVA